jgi:hypothetical protein
MFKQQSSLKPKVPSVNIGPKEVLVVTHPDGHVEHQETDRYTHPPIVFAEYDHIREADGGIYLQKILPHPAGHEVFFSDSMNQPIREALGLPPAPLEIPPVVETVK